MVAHRRLSASRCPWLAVVLSAVTIPLVLGPTSTAQAFWFGAGAGSGTGAATTMPTGTAPSGSALVERRDDQLVSREHGGRDGGSWLQNQPLQLVWDPGDRELGLQRSGHRHDLHRTIRRGRYLVLHRDSRGGELDRWPEP